MPARPDDEKRRIEGLAALVLVQVCFGLFPLLVHLATDPAGGFQPRVIAVWRMAAAALVLGSLAVLRHGRRAVPAAADLPRFLLCTLFGIVANQVLAIEGVARTSATRAGLLMTTIPVFTYVLAIAARQERFRGRRAAGIATALAGAVLLVWVKADPGSRGAGSPLGNVLIIANCLSFAGYLILARRLLDRYPSLVVVAWMFVLSLLVAPALAWGGDLVPADATGHAWRGLVGLIVLPTIVAYLLNTYALARVSASTTAVFIYLQPLVAGATGAWLLGERPGPLVLLAGGLLGLGLWFVIRGGDRVRRERFPQR